MENKKIKIIEDIQKQKNGVNLSKKKKYDIILNAVLDSFAKKKLVILILYRL
jgi:hypothetical protein